MRKVLVVEDDKFISTIFTMFLREIGHDMVGRCQTGREALEMCHAFRPDVVLMDIHLDGDWDGIQAAERIIRELNIPVIFVSSDTNSEVINRAIESNSYGYLLKPIVKSELAIGIDLAYYKHQADQELKQREKGFRQFISDSPMPIIIVFNERVQYVNNKALALLRSHYIEDVMGLPLKNFIDGDMPDCLKMIVGTAAHDDSAHSDIFLPMKDVHGNIFYAELLTSSVEFNNRKSVQIILRNIQHELKLDIRAKALEALSAKSHKAFFLIGSDNNLYEFSAAIHQFDAIESVKGEKPVSKNRIKLMLDNKDVTNAVLSGEPVGTLSVLFDENPLGNFGVVRLESTVHGFYGLLFYSE